MEMHLVESIPAIPYIHPFGVSVESSFRRLDSIELMSTMIGPDNPHLTEQVVQFTNEEGSDSGEGEGKERREKGPKERNHMSSFRGSISLSPF